ncbi:MAG: hypothetical protein IJS67_03390 [Clostridia bacterium]|nr:hypothetical protein [Clostridia bacterium]
MAENIMNLYMLSAMYNRSAKLYCIDGDTIVGDSSSLETYKAFESMDFERFKYSLTRADIIKIIHEVYDQYKANRASGAEGKNVFVFIKNLQWIDIVQKMLKDETIDEEEYLGESEQAKPADSDDPFDWGMDTSSSSSNESVSYQLRKMIDDGSSCGVYFIFSCLEYPVVKDTMYYSDNILAKIPERIIFALSDTDSDNLIDGVSVSQMKDNTVYFTDGVKNTFQFKPFVIKSAEDIKSINR